MNTTFTSGALDSPGSGVTKRSLTAPRRRLVELMQQINFGRIEGLTLRGGEPVFDPAPRIVREVKFGGENGPRPERDSSDFLLNRALGVPNLSSVVALG